MRAKRDRRPLFQTDPKRARPETHQNLIHTDKELFARSHGPPTTPHHPQPFGRRITGNRTHCFSAIQPS
jgi:hypothetical protein